MIRARPFSRSPIMEPWLISLKFCHCSWKRRSTPAIRARIMKRVPVDLSLRQETLMETQITAKLAEHASNLRYANIPSDVIEKAKDCLLDQIGVELIGSTLEWNKIAYRYVTEMAGKPESTIVNYGTKVPSLDAAFVNATFGQGCELDDVGFAAGGHLSAATVPVALALCE